MERRQAGRQARKREVKIGREGRKNIKLQDIYIKNIK